MRNFMRPFLGLLFLYLLLAGCGGPSQQTDLSEERRMTWDEFYDIMLESMLQLDEIQLMVDSLPPVPRVSASELFEQSAQVAEENARLARTASERRLHLRAAIHWYKLAAKRARNEVETEKYMKEVKRIQKKLDQKNRV